MIRNLAFIIFLSILPAMLLSQNDSTNNSHKQLRVGLHADFNMNFHSASILDPKGWEFEQKHNYPFLFESGSGYGFTFGALVELELSKDFSLALRPGYSILNGLFTRSENLPFSKLQGDSVFIVNGTYEQSLTGSLSSLNIEIIGAYEIYPSLKVNLGIAPAFLLSKSYKFSEKIIANGITFKDTDVSERDLFDGDIEDASGFQLGVIGGISYLLSLNTEKSFFIEPHLFFVYNITSISEEYDWKLSSLRLGVDAKYNINKPMSQEEIEREQRHYQFKEETERQLADIRNRKPRGKSELDILDNIEKNTTDYEIVLASYSDSKYNVKRKRDVAVLKSQTDDLKAIIKTEMDRDKVAISFQEFIDEKNKEISSYEISKERFDKNSLEEFQSIKSSIDNKTNDAKTQLEGIAQQTIVTSLNSLNQRIDALISKANAHILESKKLLEEEEERMRKHQEFLAGIEKSLLTIKDTYQTIGKDASIKQVENNIKQLKTYYEELLEQPDSIPFQRIGKDNRKKSINSLIRNTDDLINEINGFVVKLPGFDISEIFTINGNNKINSFIISDNSLYLAGYFKELVLDVELPVEKAIIANLNLESEYGLIDYPDIESKPRDEAMSIVKSKDNKILFTANFFKEITISNELLKSIGNTDIFFAEYDDSGIGITWNHPIGSKGDDFSKDIAVFGSKQNTVLYITGSFQGDLELAQDSPSDNTMIKHDKSKDPNFFIAGYKGIENRDIYTRFSAKGTSTSLLNYNDRFLFVNGNVDTRSVFSQSKDKSITLSPEKGKTNSFIAKFNHIKYGEFDTAFTISGDNNKSIAMALDEKDSRRNSYFILGEFNGKIDVDGKHLESAGKQALYIAKASATNFGQVEWLTSVLSSENIKGYDLKANNNMVYVTGSFSGSVNIANVEYTSSGKDDIFIALLDGSTGNISRFETFGSVGIDYCNKMFIYEDEVFITGFSENGIDFGSAKAVKRSDNPYIFLIKINKK